MMNRTLTSFAFCFFKLFCPVPLPARGKNWVFEVCCLLILRHTVFSFYRMIASIKEIFFDLLSHNCRDLGPTSLVPVIFKFPLIWFPSVFRLLSSRHFTNILKLILLQCKHRIFLEHWNRQKILSSIQQRFSCLLDERIEKKCNFNLHVVMSRVLTRLV